MLIQTTRFVFYNYNLIACIFTGFNIPAMIANINGLAGFAGDFGGFP